jgi:hypothetical protein
MLAFRVRLNGRRLKTVGIAQTHVLGIGVLSIERTNRIRRAAPQKLPRRELYLHLSGAETREDGSGEQLDWGDVSLRIGDKLAVEIVEADDDDIDPPKHRKPFTKKVEPSRTSSAKKPRRTRAV